MKACLDFNDWWAGVYLCPLPCVVVRWRRRLHAVRSTPQDMGLL